MLANIEVLVIVLGQDDLLLVVLEFQVGDIIFLLIWYLLASCLLLLPLFSLLLELLFSLLGLAREIPRADLSAQDTGLGPIASLDAETDLCQDKLDLFPPLHGAERLNL